MYLILQQEKPDDYVIATGVTTTIRDLVKFSAAELGLEISFRGEGTEEKGFITAIDEKVFIGKVGEKFLEGIKARKTENPKSELDKNKVIVAVDPTYFRPTEVDLLIGDSSKARKQLNWEPQYDLKGLVKDMMQSDVNLMKKDSYLSEGGYRTLNYFE